MNFTIGIMLIVKLLTKDQTAKNTVMEKLHPQITKSCYIDKHFDEDLYEYLIENINEDLTKFKIYQKNYQKN